MIKSAVYSAHATSTGGRTGTSATDDERLSVTLDTPKEMGGNGGPGTNPEQLFAVGYSACFLGALKAVGRMEKVSIPDDAKINATVHFGENADGPGYGIAVELEISVPGIDHDQAVALVDKAHQICPYSNATRGNIEVKLSVV
ncbi:organic hydroperoxide resistance protein [Mariluticola halotolerans]|uniref:organic hydroperoxide resistance protein n=1 Tax=Mariluticola halotolerans TaxID=2909283 RepID=UPI0026E34347|nr:organic hydroperoxide resistance protein [Mariluticola halotolerans]UJQ94493.1 organic hydroperoxide resistance protein [Mariluticola halotolerans]